MKKDFRSNETPSSYIENNVIGRIHNLVWQQNCPEMFEPSSLSKSLFKLTVFTNETPRTDDYFPKTRTDDPKNHYFESQQFLLHVEHGFKNSWFSFFNNS